MYQEILNNPAHRLYAAAAAMAEERRAATTRRDVVLQQLQAHRGRLAELHWAIGAEPDDDGHTIYSLEDIEFRLDDGHVLWFGSTTDLDYLLTEEESVPLIDDTPIEDWETLETDGMQVITNRLSALTGIDAQVLPAYLWLAGCYLRSQNNAGGLNLVDASRIE